jgi:hypothetical protein
MVEIPLTGTDEVEDRAPDRIEFVGMARID